MSDSDEDILSEDDVLKLYKAFDNRDNFDLYHNYVLLNDVKLFESYITRNIETIGLQEIPIGSWVITVKSDNTKLNELILNNKLTGVSLTNIIKPSCPLQPNTKYEDSHYYDYSDLKDLDCIQPLSISFVEQPANMFGLSVFDEPNFIIKQKKVKKMGLLEDLKKLLSSYEKVEDETTQEEVEVVEEAVEEVKEIEQETAEETTEESPAIEKEEKEEETKENVPDVQAQIDDIYKRLEALENSSKEEEPSEEPKIVKKEKKVIMEETPQKTQNYFELSGRDPATGLKIKN